MITQKTKTISNNNPTSKPHEILLEVALSYVTLTPEEIETVNNYRISDEYRISVKHYQAYGIFIDFSYLFSFFGFLVPKDF